MNKNIESLKSELESLESEITVITKPVMDRARVLKQELKNAYFDVFNSDADIKAAISKLESSTDYGADSDGIYAYARYYAPKEWTRDIDARNALEDYFQDYGFHYDADNDALICRYGDEEIIIQDDTRRDNGVWQGHKLIIAESEYLDDGGDVDESKRNALIEAHMQRTGYFPGVFRLTERGDVFPVDTHKRSA
jgi:hypothetical protein